MGDNVRKTQAISGCFVSPREIHAAHRAVGETVKSVRSEFPKISGDGMVKTVAGAVAAMFTERIEALERRIAELEARPTVKYLGVYRENKAYGSGSMVTAAGGIWHANRATCDRPGSSDAWTLACKRGADGKDARR
jgi:hypothetical protein